MPFDFKPSVLPEVIVVEPRFFSDTRGGFAEIFRHSDFLAQGIDLTVLQGNLSVSSKDVLRGLHYQLNPRSQAKLVSVLKGEVFDVAVDIRRGSPTFGAWVGERLSEVNRKMLYVPAGFAHGFCTLSDEAEIIYYCSAEYAPDLERCIIWNDPDLNIAWPEKSPVLSPRDKEGVPLANAQINFEYRSAQ
ncbi:MAG: dTDP-4-dehydrorhamnose 3,5-epimerase [Candidatus Omnitrophica bacterium]|nr:dTDP-4-dehydrorhamnose 3,5-epimerase [Candidatus Omnitrophota bacterium]